MLKLIRLEWKKNRIGKDVRNAVILALCLGFFVYSVEFFGITDEIPEANSIGISAFIELLTNMSFIVFCGAMLASYIVGAYKNKTMNLMFSYPIKRQKILASQMIAVWSFNFIALTLTKLLIYLCVFMGAKFMPSSFTIDFCIGSLSFYIQLILKSVVIVSMSFIALFVGIAMKSSKATVLTSFLLIFLTQANVGDFTISNNAIFPVILTVISFGFAGLSIYNAERNDLI